MLILKLISLALFWLQGGVQSNVVADQLEVGFDLRVTPTEVEQVDKMLEEWCKECDVTIKWVHVSLFLISLFIYIFEKVFIRLKFADEL